MQRKGKAMKDSIRPRPLGWAACIVALGLWMPCQAQVEVQIVDSEGNLVLVEEVVVTAQRRVENIQDVPISVTALTGTMLEDRQTINPSDLQMAAPNISYTATNFGSQSISVRGVGQLVISGTGEPGVSAHVNEIPIESNLNAMEFFDMERVEILRGPQGTLFGRNATGGAINFITKMPTLERIEGFADVEVGDYSHTRFKGALNLPLSDFMGLRFAGYKLNRDGYIENLAYGQTDANGNRLPGIDEDLDGRDILALRGTFAWDFSDRGRFWVQYSLFDEDDDRARIPNQVCARNSLPTTGCVPDGFGFDAPHWGASTDGILAGSIGALPAGADGSDPAMFAYPRPVIDGFRQIHTDMESMFQDREDFWSAGFNYDFGSFNLNLLGAWQQGEFLSRQDYRMDVGPSLSPSPFNPSGLYPISEPAGGAGDEWRPGPCNLNDGTSGVLGGCILPVDQTRVFAYDQSDAEEEYWTVEGRLQSALEGPLNFQIGASAYDRQSVTDYYVLSNALDLASTAGIPLPPQLPRAKLYPGFFSNTDDPSGGILQDGWAVFGELYFDLTERVKLTAGLRHNEDNKEIRDSSVLFDSLDASTALGGVFGPDPIWIRLNLFQDMAAAAADPSVQLSGDSAKLLEFWDAQGIYAQNAQAIIGGITAIGLTQRVVAPLVQSGALPPANIPGFLASLGLPEVLQGTVLALLSQNPQAIAQDPGLLATAAGLKALAAAIPPVPGFGETRFVTGSPSKGRWSELSGRIGLDWQVSENSLIYGFYSRGYKPGGFNSAIPPQFQGTSGFTFSPEQVDAFEIGVKNSLLDGRLLLNGAFFLYDYSGMQITRIRNNTALNENIDSDILGLEVEGVWRPEALPGLALDFGYGWLKAEVDGSQSLDPINRTAGNADYVLLNNIDPGDLTGINFVARESQITQQVVDAALDAGTARDIRNRMAVQNVSYAPNAAGVSIPVYFSRGFLDSLGIETLDGLPIDLDGNQLPNSPEHSIRLGLAYTWDAPMLRGFLTARWDYYWQDESYAREFNSIGDAIASWSQHNAALIYESRDRRWTLKAWVRNLTDEENVTGKYLTSDTSGSFRNYFLTEPRLYGASFRYNFGG